MASEKRRWVVLGVSDETRRAVTGYAALRNQTIAQVLEDELEKVRTHMEWVFSVQHDVAVAMTSRGELDQVAD